MRNRCLSLVLAAFLVLGISLSASAYTGSGLDLTGREWAHSSQSEKLAFLYGASSVVAIEQLIAQQQGTPPSAFVRSWIKAFNDVNWLQLQKLLDEWYAAHPGDADRQVFDVLWREYMLPADK